MIKVELSKNIWVECFDDSEIVKWSERGYYLKYLSKYKSNNVEKLIYWGKTDEITEELAKECVSFIDNPRDNGRDIPFKDYSHNFLGVKTAKESIESACDKKYCLICKTDVI